MMKFALLLILPCLIVADTQCNGELSCPEGKSCCTVNGKPDCCDAEDLEAPLPQRPTFMFAPNITVQNGTYSDCLFICSGTCCGSGVYTSCCPLKLATCCSGNRCCDFASTCCPSGCCAMNGKCCGTGCCPMNGRCCGSWCCESYQRCGLSYRTCYNAAVGLYPTTFVTLIAVGVAAYVVTKM